MPPATVLIGAVSLGLSARYGERTVLLAGLALLIAALGLLVRPPADASYPVHLLPTMLLIGGGGLVLSALTVLGMSAAGPEDAGVASGLFNTTQQIGAALGVAVLTTLSAGRTTRLQAAGHPLPDALTSGFHLAFAVATGLLALSFLLTALLLRPTPVPTGQPVPVPVA